MRHLFRVICLAMCVLGVSCKYKRPSSNEVKSLDNFAGGNVTNNCSSKDPTFALTPAEKGANDEMVHAALSSVPPPLRDRFFNKSDLNGSIKLHANPSTACTPRTGKGDASDFLGLAGCLTWDLRKSGENYRLTRITINLSRDQKQINHALVRLFGYIASQVLPRKRTINGEQVWSPEAEELTSRAAKKLVAGAYFKDTIQRNGGLEIISKNLNADVDLAHVVAKLKQLPEIPNVNDLYPFVKFAFDKPASRQMEFEDFVYAEAFDSYYCNNWSRDPADGVNSREEMKTRFKLTFKAYEEGAKKGFALDGGEYSTPGNTWSQSGVGEFSDGPVAMWDFGAPNPNYNAPTDAGQGYFAPQDRNGTGASPDGLTAFGAYIPTRQDSFTSDELGFGGGFIFGGGGGGGDG